MEPELLQELAIFALSLHRPIELFSLGNIVASKIIHLSQYAITKTFLLLRFSIDAALKFSSCDVLRMTDRVKGQYPTIVNRDLNCANADADLSVYGFHELSSLGQISL